MLMTAPRVLVAMNTFKGSLTNREACAAVGEALTKLQIPFTQIPVADGGRGCRDTVMTKWTGEVANISATGPLGGSVTAQVFCSPNDKTPTRLFIESPDVCGFLLIATHERDPMRTTSEGLGELLLKCQSRWKVSLREIYIGLGDSAISDAGMGMLSRLGFQFLDGQGRQVIANGDGLARLEDIIPPKSDPLPGVRLTVLCDVANPLCGPTGSARVFAPQKGASPEDVERLSHGMDTFAFLTTALTGKPIAREPFTGSAGGLAAALFGFLDAELVAGAQYLLDLVDFDKHLADCDVLITGEGSTDRQTLSGKAPKECLLRATKLKKAALIISGSLGEGAEFKENPKFLGCFASGREPSAYEALKNETYRLFSDPAFAKF